MPWIVPASRCIRPLIKNTRKEIEQFAKEANLKWVEDSSNSSTKYTRNFFRNEWLPALQKVYPQAEQNLTDNIDRFKKTAALYNLLVRDLKGKLCKGEPPEVRIPVKQLVAYQNTSLIYEIIKDYGFGEKQVAEVVKLCNSDSGKYIQNETYQIIKHRAWLVIAPITEKGSTIAIEKKEKNIRFVGGILEFKQVKKEKLRLNKQENVAQLDASKISFPLLLRRWKEGDYFYPLGMQKKKKVARFLVDQKLAKNEKENIWVIESAQRIIWIVGHRIDDRFKIRESTKEVLEIFKTSL
jgi:tRNA(Ile)-lysidine synthase